ncbi:MAG: tyrosine-type recombinase/integrase [Burkholderiales bacterium]
MPKLTKRFVESLKPGSADLVIFDELVPGFGVRVMPSGVRSYLVQYRNTQRRSRRLTIGKHGVLTVDLARDRARKILAAARDGRDPVAEKRVFLEAPTVNVLLDRYLAEHVNKRNRASTAAEIRRLVDRHIRHALGTQKVAAVTARDVGALHGRMSDTPRQANFMLAVCSKAFTLAETWQDRPPGSNPCRGIERYPEQHRERFLSGVELMRLGEVLRLAVSQGLPWSDTVKRSKHLAGPENRRSVYTRVTTAAIELLLYTGCRLSEVLNLEWDRVDLTENIITLHETKVGAAQVVVVSAPARRVLDELALHNFRARWVLPSRGDAEHPLSKTAIEQAWQRIRAVAKLEDVRLHDLRHTVGTYAGQTGANAFLVRDLLRHSNIAMTGRYVNRADDPVRTLCDQVAARIEAGLSGQPTAKVVELRR